MIRSMSIFFGALSGISILLATIVTCEMIFVRYVFRASTYWQTELVTYLLLGAVFIGSPYLAMKKGHVTVDILEMIDSERIKHVARSLVLLVVILFCFVIAVAGALHTWSLWARGVRSETLWAIPMWIPWITLPIGLGWTGVQYFHDGICFEPQ